MEAKKSLETKDFVKVAIERRKIIRMIPENTINNQEFQTLKSELALVLGDNFSISTIKENNKVELKIDLLKPRVRSKYIEEMKILDTDIRFFGILAVLLLLTSGDMVGEFIWRGCSLIVSLRAVKGFSHYGALDHSQINRTLSIVD